MISGPQKREGITWLTELQAASLSPQSLYQRLHGSEAYLPPLRYRLSPRRARPSSGTSNSLIGDRTSMNRGSNILSGNVAHRKLLMHVMAGGVRWNLFSRKLPYIFNKISTSSSSSAGKVRVGRLHAVAPSSPPLFPISRMERNHLRIMIGKLS